MKKRFIALSLALAMGLSMASIGYAENENEGIIGSADTETEILIGEEVEPQEAYTEIPSGVTANTVNIRIDMIKHPLVNDSFVKLELYSMDGALLDTQREWVGGITDYVEMTFNVPAYTLGQSFKLKFVEGLNSLKYYDDTYYPGNEFTIGTYTYKNDAGYDVLGNSFAFEGDPSFRYDVVTYKSHSMFNLSPKARVIDNVIYVPLRQFAESYGLNVRYDERYNSVAVSIENKIVAYNINSPITNYFGTDKDMGAPTRSIGGFVFVPANSLTEAFKIDAEIKDFIDHYDLILGNDSQVVNEYYNQFFVNRQGIGSQTNYLIWVSKSEYKVRVYKGQYKHWTPIKEYTCAIGAPGTPTITGQFNYFSKETSWDYDGYYVGPIMRFYNGYALHSTLRYYGGGEYDGRVGVQISHGCVRLHPADITWLVNNIPLYTRIYITD